MEGYDIGQSSSCAHKENSEAVNVAVEVEFGNSSSVKASVSQDQASIQIDTLPVQSENQPGTDGCESTFGLHNDVHDAALREETVKTRNSDNNVDETPASSSEEENFPGTATDDSQREDDPNSTPVKKRKPRPGYVNLNKVVLEPNAKKRTELAKKRGKCLQTAARLMHERTGAKVYLQCQYQGKKSEPYDFNYGTNFGETPVHQQIVVDNADMHQVVKDSFKSAVEELATLKEPSGSSPADTSFDSPSVPRSTRTIRRQASVKGCLVCGGEEPTIGCRSQSIQADFFVCSRQGCQVKAHNDCLGFPSVRDEDMKAAFKWFCPIHVGSGRDPVINPEVADSSMQQLAGTSTNDGVRVLRYNTVSSNQRVVEEECAPAGGSKSKSTKPKSVPKSSTTPKSRSAAKPTMQQPESTGTETPPEPKKRGRPRKIV